MLIGVSTENFALRPTPLSKDIDDIAKFKVKAIEIVPKTPADLRAGGALSSCTGTFEYIAVLIPPPPVNENKSSPNNIPPYYQDGLAFSAEIHARLVILRPDFSACKTTSDVVKFFQPIISEAAKQNLTIALVNWFAPESQCGTFDQVSDVVKALNCKLVIDLSHAHRAMHSKSVWFVGEQKGRIAAIRASDATDAFGELPLGTGHVNYPAIIPLLAENGFSGPYFISHMRDPRPESILTSISFLEYFEL